MESSSVCLSDVPHPVFLSFRSAQHLKSISDILMYLSGASDAPLGGFWIENTGEPYVPAAWLFSRLCFCVLCLAASRLKMVFSLLLRTLCTFDTKTFFLLKIKKCGFGGHLLEWIG